MMKKYKEFTAILFLVALAGCVTQYSGKGGMTANKIDPAVYIYHYEKGFTGPDAMGWDPNLQFAWSRIGTAKTCAVPYSQERMVAALIKQYGQDKLTHEMIGIGFHHSQSRAIQGFCTAERIAQVNSLVTEMEAGRFLKRF